MPTLILVVFAVLIGWPLVKLVTTATGRRLWDRQRALRSQLEADDHYGTPEHRIIAERFDDGKGSIGQLALPFVVLFGGMSAALSLSNRNMPRTGDLSDGISSLKARLLHLEHPEMTSATHDLLRDARFRELDGRVVVLQSLRYPVCTLATLVALIPPLVLIACLRGLRVSLETTVRGILESSQDTVQLFASSLRRSIRSA